MLGTSKRLLDILGSSLTYIASQRWGWLPVYIASHGEYTCSWGPNYDRLLSTSVKFYGYSSDS